MKSRTPGRTGSSPLTRTLGAWRSGARAGASLRGFRPAAGETPYLVLLRLDQLEAFAQWHGAQAAEAVVEQVREGVTDQVASARPGRSARGVIEFAFSATDADAARIQTARMIEKLEERLPAGAAAVGLRLAAGVAALESDLRIDDIVQRAERALALTETSAARCVLWTEKQHADAAERVALARDLRAAIAGGQLTVAYQPKLHFRNGVIDSAEALVRWTHPERGAIRPDEFVALAEESGDIGRLTHFVLAETIKDRAQLVAHGHDISINVNLSAQLVADEEFCAEVLAVCAPHGGKVGLEITETSVFTHPERALANLHRFAEAGIPIAIDDYGSGLSSLAYLKQLPAAELKIDQLFISSLVCSHRDPLIVRSTIDLAHALEMEVTAEGVDHPAALALLKVMGCDRGQGFHISPALPLEKLIGFLDEAAGRNFVNESKSLLSLNIQKKTFR